jgi:hypothetical protein
LLDHFNEKWVVLTFNVEFYVGMVLSEVFCDQWWVAKQDVALVHSRVNSDPISTCREYQVDSFQEVGLVLAARIS